MQKSVSERHAAYAATPPLLQVSPVGESAKELLMRIAATVARLPEAEQHAYTEVSAQEWSLWTNVGQKAVSSEVVPSEWTLWRGPDGAGKMRTRLVVPTGEEMDTVSLVVSGDRWPTSPPALELEALERQLAEGHPAENGPAERIVAISDVCRNWPLQPAQRAALLRFLAATPGLDTEGMVTDRLGRAGIAFSLISAHSGLPTKYTVIVDPDTGAILGTEQVLTETAGKLNVPIPAVVSYTAFGTAEWRQSPSF